MPKAPFAKPEAAPAAVDASVPGMDFNAKPRHINKVATSTNILRANCMGAGEM